MINDTTRTDRVRVCVFVRVRLICAIIECLCPANPIHTEAEQLTFDVNATDRHGTENELCVQIEIAQMNWINKLYECVVCLSLSSCQFMRVYPWMCDYGLIRSESIK